MPKTNDLTDKELTDSVVFLRTKRGLKVEVIARRLKIGTARVSRILASKGLQVGSGNHGKQPKGLQHSRKPGPKLAREDQAVAAAPRNLVTKPNVLWLFAAEVPGFDPKEMTLHGKPTNIPTVAKLANTKLKSEGRPQILHNPNWKV